MYKSSKLFIFTIFTLALAANNFKAIPIYLTPCIFKNNNNQFQLMKDYQEVSSLELEIDIDKEAGDYNVDGKVVLKFGNHFFMSKGSAKFMRHNDLEKLHKDLETGTPFDFSVIKIGGKNETNTTMVAVRCLGKSEENQNGDDSFMELI